MFHSCFSAKVTLEALDCNYSEMNNKETLYRIPLWCGKSKKAVIDLKGINPIKWKYYNVCNKYTYTFILFGNFLSPCTALFEPACLLILKETIVPAGLLKPAPFWILLLVVSKNKVKSAEIAFKMLHYPWTTTREWTAKWSLKFLTLKPWEISKSWIKYTLTEIFFL